MFIAKYTAMQWEDFFAVGESIEEVISELENITGDSITVDDVEWFDARRIKVETKIEYIVSEELQNDF